MQNYENNSVQYASQENKERKCLSYVIMAEMQRKYEES
jgi:hypothetical protein